MQAVVVPQMVRELRHLRLMGVADEEGSATRQDDHRDDRAVGSDVAEGREDFGQARERASGRARAGAERGPVGRLPQPQRQRQVDQDVQQDAPGGSEGDHQRTAHRRPEQDPELPPRRDRPDRALELGRTDDVVDQELRRGRPDHPREAVQDQKHGSVPNLEGIGQEQDAPAGRDEHEQHHAELDDPAGIEPVGERPGIDREQQERHPVGEHREAGERRRFELLEDDPVADHMLDIVRHHGEHRVTQIGAPAGMAERREGL